MRWDPAQYLRFADQRSRPFGELLARVGAQQPGTVVDLGCGPGHLTADLARRWPHARVIGVDSSPEMVARARRGLDGGVDGTVQLIEADLRDWQPPGPVDVLVSNATLQWVPGHLELLPWLAGWLAPDGWLAIQVPGNFAEPSHTELAELCATERWRDRLGADLPRPAAHDPADYLQALAACGLQVDAWETTYLQVLSGPDAVYEWARGTTLVPVLAQLEPDGAEELCEDYRGRLARRYLPGPAGTLMPFRRVFAVAHRPALEAEPAPSSQMITSSTLPNSEPGVSQGLGVGTPSEGPEATSGPTLAALHHVQLAAPPGSEPALRAFYARVLGMTEVAKPPVLAARGGAWFRAGRLELHLGVEQDFRPARKAHPGLLAGSLTDLRAIASRLEAAGHPVRWDGDFPGYHRFYTEDPRGNRLELLAAEDGWDG